MTITEVLRQKLNVMNAVILRDMRTRFFNHGLGFLVQSLWPLAHMVILLTIYKLGGRTAPFGDSLNVFFATGLIPTLAFLYISKFMSLSLLLNRSMLSFPIVKMTDIIFARAFLEVIANCVAIAALYLILTGIGDDPKPYDLLQAVYALLATILLAVGLGTLVSVFSFVTEIFVTVWAVLGIVFYISSGVLFVLSNLPDPIAIPLSWNPVLQCVEWMRVAFYENYSDRYLNREYVIMFGASSLMLGLTLERVLRTRMLEG